MRQVEQQEGDIGEGGNQVAGDPDADDLEQPGRVPTGLESATPGDPGRVAGEGEARTQEAVDEEVEHRAEGDVAVDEVALDDRQEGEHRDRPLPLSHPSALPPGMARTRTRISSPLPARTGSKVR